MQVGIQIELLKLNSLGLLEPLLQDKTTKSNILWGTDAYADVGSAYQKDRPITLDLITGEHSGIIKNRARKALEQQNERTRQHAEVFTPLWICDRMNNYADEVWFGQPDMFRKDGKPTDRVQFASNYKWTAYVNARDLEITCGEAPYLVSRYDVSTGDYIPIPERIGLLDRKLRVVNENATNEAEWLTWATKAYQAIYGYEYQGDNLLIARMNLLITFEEYMLDRWGRKPTMEEYKKIANVVAWNIWQMDGLTGAIPYCTQDQDTDQITLEGWYLNSSQDRIDGKNSEATYCRIKNWRQDHNIEFRHVTEGERKMKFDFIIGNPPYQTEAPGTSTSDKPIYNYFMDAVYPISNRVELITPGRFLFNAGATPSAWNKKMLEDPHIKVLYYEQDSSKVFPNTDIKGGVAITYRDTEKNFGAIGTFTSYSELNSIFKKVHEKTPIGETLNNIIYTQNKFNLDVLNKAIPGLNRTDKRLESNIFKLPIFTEEMLKNDDFKILGLINNKRVYRYVHREFIDAEESHNLFKYKIILPKSNGSGAIGEVLSTPLIGTPLIGYTRSFIGIGAFDTQFEAEAAFKYVKSKFCRTMLGILKITQDNNPEKWRYVPLQNFTANSDIDWSQSISNIDQQLYKKYGLDDKEIQFIETHVKEMN